MLVDIVVGSVLGASEYVAEALMPVFQRHGYQASCHFTPKWEDLSDDSIIVVCSSTHGAGDLPDNIQDFVKAIDQQSLQQRSCIVIGLGDSSYDTFCHASIKIEDALLQAGAHLLTPALHIDVLHHPIPEEKAVEYLSAYLSSHTT